MFRKGNRLFLAANIVLLLVASLHTTGLFRTPSEDAEVQVIEKMKQLQFEALGMSWTLHDVLMSLGFTMTVFMVFAAVINLFILASNPPKTLVRTVSFITAAFMWVLALLYGLFQIPPPFFSFILLGILFTVSGIRHSARPKDTMVSGD